MHGHAHATAPHSGGGSGVDFVLRLFDTDFMRRGECVDWRPEIVWLHVVSDAMIALAYYSIPLALIYFVRKRQDLAFNWIFVLFAGFILACGSTHVISVLAFWYPMYRLDGVVKAGTGAISVVTAIALWPLIPRAIAMPGPSALRAKNDELQLYASALREARDELQRSHDELELRVRARTAELAHANDALRQEVAARARVEQDLRLSESRFRLAIESSPISMFSQDRDLRFTWMCNSRHGLTPQQVIGKTDGEVYDASCVPLIVEMKRAVLQTGVGSRQRLVVSRHGNKRVIDYLIEPIRDPVGEVSGLTGVGVDVTEQSEAEQALEFQKYALDQHAIVAITDHRGRITYVNEKFCAISRYSREELLAQDHRIVNSGHHPKSFFKDMYARIASGHVWRGEIRNRAKDGSIYWVDTTIVPMTNAEGRVTNYVAIRSDITSRKASEERQRFLVAELDHRVKNNLAVVLSIAQETMRFSGTKQEFNDSFIGRLRAMARTHSALAAAKWEGARLMEILRITLEAHLFEGSRRVAIHGEDLVLSHRASAVLSMTFNELATNAAKYGSLSNPEGRISIRWDLPGEDAPARVLTLTWEESDGPQMQPPTKQGLGTQFITDGVAYELGGAAELDYRPEGLRCILTLPLENILAEESVSASPDYGDES